MNITITLSDLLRTATGLKEPIVVSGENPMECLRELASRFPAIHKWLFDERDRLRPQVWVLVNGERIYEKELVVPLKDGDEISIMIAVLGG